MTDLPRFATRLPWTAVPAEIVTELEQALGAPVVTSSVRVGGFSPGYAGVLGLGDGRSVFVKAVSTAQNARTPELLRAERDRSPADPSVPALIHAFERAVDGADWVLLVFEAVSGTSPVLPWRYDDARLVLDELAMLSSRLTPSPRQVEPVAGALDGFARDWAAARETGSPVLAGWVADNLAQLEGLAHSAAASVHGSTMVHLDLRADNVLIDRSGSAPVVWFVDWPWAHEGPAWLDAALLALDFAAYGDLVPEQVLADAGVHPPMQPLAAVLACLAGNWARALTTPAQPGMGGIREFQRRFFDATQEWLRRLLG